MITGDINPEVVDTLKLSVDHGVLVKEVFKASPAAKAGLEAGDVVTAVAGQAVRSPRELVNVIAALKPESQTLISCSAARIAEAAAAGRPAAAADDGRRRAGMRRGVIHG